jgi:hypothetical protein
MRRHDASVSDLSAVCRCCNLSGPIIESEFTSPFTGLCAACSKKLAGSFPVVNPLAGVEQPRRKANYVGAPAIFALDLCCQTINEAFGDYGCYLVGSSLESPDWRDVDVRYIMADASFAALFPDANIDPGTWENDPRWLLLTTSISGWLKLQTGLPVDFQIQPQSHANERHKGPRHYLGMRTGKRKEGF